MTVIPYEIEDDSYYLFTCAELKAREKEFVSHNRMKRMLSAGDMEEFLKVLGETVYASGMASIEQERSFEQVILTGYRAIIDYLEERLKDEHRKLIQILFFEEFLHNVKLILKSDLLERPLEELYIPLKYEYSYLVDAYRTGKYEEIEEPLPEIMEYIKQITSTPDELDPRMMELDLEAFYMERLRQTAESLEHRMISDYIRYRIDLLNIEIIYRNKQLKEERSFAGLLHKGGSLDLKTLTELEDESMDYIVRELEKTDYADVIIRGAQRLFSDCSFSSFERNSDLYFLDYFDTIKYSVSNLEKIFQFFFKKKTELININILYTGIRYNADKSNIRCKVD
jgi:V/A-type H+-transporting ATPase subunit C